MFKKDGVTIILVAIGSTIAVSQQPKEQHVIQSSAHDLLVDKFKSW